MTDRGRLHVTPPTNRERSALTPRKEPSSSGGQKEAKLAYCEADGSDSQPRVKQEELQTTSGTASLKGWLTQMTKKNPINSLTSENYSQRGL